MESVLDEFNTGPAEGLMPVAMRDPRYLELNSQEKLVLATFLGSPAYHVLFKLFEGEVQKAETEHFQKWRDKKEFHRTGLFAVSMRIAMERIQREINRQVEELSGEFQYVKNKQEQAGKSLEDQIQEE